MAPRRLYLALRIDSVYFRRKRLYASGNHLQTVRSRSSEMDRSGRRLDLPQTARLNEKVSCMFEMRRVSDNDGETYPCCCALLSRVAAGELLPAGQETRYSRREKPRRRFWDRV